MMKTKQRCEMSERESPTEINVGRQPINYFAANGTLLALPFRGQVELGKTVFVDLNRNSLPSVPPSQANLVVRDA